jgi:competence protein ComEA
MRNWQLVCIGILVGIIFSGLILLVASPPRGTPFELVTPSTPQIIIHITGAVLHPGVYTLPINSRLNDAITSAGGTLPNVDTNQINLSEFITDGERIYIPSTDDPISTYLSTSAPAKLIKSTETKTIFPININLASEEELSQLPGIGSTRARDIVLYREKYGPFKTIEDLKNVSGIGPITFDSIKNLIVVH